MCYNKNGDNMKDILKIFFMVCVVLLVYIFKDNISNFIMDDIVYGGSNKVLTYNEYYLDYDYGYVQNTDSKNVKNRQEILNIFYTILNSGDTSFSFYCSYDNCLNDVKDLIESEYDITDINNFVHPFNSFSNININISNSGKITVKTKKTYNDSEIKYIENYIQNFIDNNINDNMSKYDKIKIFHDHIINNTIYDKSSNQDSSNAYNLLTTGKSICGGYSDVMSVYLNMIGIQNYKITSENHVWNLVNLDGSWYHLDLTWDDPVASDGNQYLLHNFFMIKSDELLKLDSIEHNFNKKIYIEAD